jgi:mono/diheme cytochrome c family protein
MVVLLLLIGFSEAAEGQVDFVRDIYPLMNAACLRCHGPEKAKGGLRLDTWDHAHQGGDEGPSIIPGKPDDSPFFKRLVTTDDDERMPRGADALSASKIAAVRAWIAAGAPWPADAAEQAAHQQRSWWSFQPLVVVEPPAATAWARTRTHQGWTFAIARGQP